MSRFSSHISKVIKKTNLNWFKSQMVFLDLGSYQIKLLIDGQVVRQPSTLIANPEGDVITIGNQASQYKNKLQAKTYQTKLIQPIKNGVVAQVEYAQKLLQSLIKSQPNYNWSLANQLMVTVPADISPVERKALEKISQNLGFNQLKTESKITALANRMSQIGQALTNMLIIDWGDQTCELGVVVNGLVEAEATLNFGSQRVGEQIKTVIRDQLNLEISYSTTEKLKQILAVVAIEPKTIKERKVSLRGWDISRQQVQTNTLTNKQLIAPLNQVVEQLIDRIKFKLDQFDITSLAEAANNGIYITGGGSQLTGFDNMLRREFRTEVIISPSPLLDLVRGLSNEQAGR